MSKGLERGRYAEKNRSVGALIRRIVLSLRYMKVVIDDKIPYIRDAAAQIFDEVVYLPGSEIAPRDVRDADALMVRTRTRCDEALLRGSRVKMVATATIGFEH